MSQNQSFHIYGLHSQKRFFFFWNQTCAQNAEYEVWYEEFCERMRISLLSASSSEWGSLFMFHWNNELFYYFVAYVASLRSTSFCHSPSASVSCDWKFLSDVDGAEQLPPPSVRVFGVYCSMQRNIHVIRSRANIQWHCCCLLLLLLTPAPFLNLVHAQHTWTL